MKKTKKAAVAAAEPSPAPAETATPTPPGEFKIVPRNKVRPDPHQPRKVFDTEKLEELAASIRSNGIMQPLVVQLVPIEITVHEPDLVNSEWHATDRTGAVVFQGDEQAVKLFARFRDEEYFQIIFGERRWRAAELAGLEQIPVIVREITEKDRFILQFTENNARVNLTALEEARAFSEQLQARRQSDPAFNAEKLGEELGIKRSTIYNRLKLLRLHEPIRQALIAGKIEVSVASAIASVPDVKKQEAILKEIEQDADYNGSVMSFRAVEELIYAEYAKNLKDAPFDREDATLVPVRWQVLAGENELIIETKKQPTFPHPATIGTPKLVRGESWRADEVGRFFVCSNDNMQMAGPLPRKIAQEVANFLRENAKAPGLVVTRYGGGPCTDCPHRSGVMDPEAKNPNVCTVTSCFDAKVKAHWLKKAETLREKGTPVLTEGELRKRGKHIPEDKHEYTANRTGTWKELMGKNAPEPVLVATKEGIKRFYPADEAIAAAKKNGTKFYSHRAPKTKEDAEKEKAAEKAKEERKQNREAIADDLLPLVAEALAKVSDKDGWALLDGQKVESWDYEARSLKMLIKSPKTAKARALGRLFASRECRLVEYDGDWSKEALAMYKAVGIDVLAEEKKRETTKPAAPELALKDGEATQKELPGTAGKPSKKPKKKK